MADPLTEQITSVVQMLESQHGAFYLVALFLRVDANDRWDLVVSAPWLHDDSLADLRLIANPMQNHLSVQNLVRISHISIVDGHSEDVTAIREEFAFARKPIELWNRSFFDKDLRQAVIIAASHLIGTRG